MKATRLSVASIESRCTSKVGYLKNLLMFPKDKEEMIKQSNVIYWYKTGRTERDDEYIRESVRTFEERYKEHLKAPSPIFEHNNTTGHTTSVENFKIIGREGHGIWQESSKKPFTSESTTLPSIKTLANTICHIFGTRFCFPSQN